MTLSSVQQQIVDTSGNLIVRASAGTGKTHTMVAKIAAEIEQNHSHKAIAAITFTIKAAQEIKERLTVDISNHFIGTNNSFAIEEIIKPFLKDVYGAAYDDDMSTDYSVRVDTFEEGLAKIKQERILCSYKVNKNNFIFDLAFDVMSKSSACKLYLQAKYFKIYIDEYQDCDEAMHKFFMYICDDLDIDTFIVGDEKQSIYIWRGAYPEAFRELWEKPNFQRKFMGDNFRSSKQIQNYSNLLFEETRELYRPMKRLDDIVLIASHQKSWVNEVLKHISLEKREKRTALLRYKNSDAERGASELSQAGATFVFIPQPPIADITTETAWLYAGIAKHIILQEYSVYDFVSEIPSEGIAESKNITAIKKHLELIVESTEEQGFCEAVINLCEYLGYKYSAEHLSKLFITIDEKRYYAAFDTNKYQNIALTLHSSKGLEFDQVILFAGDYNFSKKEDVYNHYVAVTRAKEKVVIIKFDDYPGSKFENNLSEIVALSGLNVDDLVTLR